MAGGTHGLELGAEQGTHVGSDLLVPVVKAVRPGVVAMLAVAEGATEPAEPKHPTAGMSLVASPNAWHYREMRPASVATAFDADRRLRIAAMTANERVALALELGRWNFEAYAAAHGLERRAARRAVERRRQSRRRPSACMDALLR